MPVPINSLQDLLTIRELKNQANPTYSAIQALSEGVAMGIKEQQEAAKKKKEQEEKIAQLISMQTQMGGTTNSLKIKPAIDKEGNISYNFEVKDKADEELKQRRLDMQNDSEERRQINDSGRSFKLDNADDLRVAGRLGLDLNKMMEEGKATRSEDGSIYVYDKTTRNRIEENKTIPETVQKAISEFKDSKDILTDAVAEYKSMNLNDVKTDWNVFQQIINPVGPLSAEAKSNLLRQINNPRLAALSDKLERVFQKYRSQVTGAQASDMELQRLRPLIANLAQNPETFLLNAEGLLKELDNSVENRLNIAKISGRDEKVIGDIKNLYYGGASTVSAEQGKTKTGNTYRRVQ